ncbi:MAG: hypothetical protein IPK80_05580 [Nannocystis sp.]|nr:hypothetical protein [Nannocystis sp.]
MSRSRSTGLSLRERWALAALDRVSALYLGFRPPVNDEAIRSLGVRGYMRWSMTTGKVMKALATALGEAEAQFVIGFAGLWLGCGYCGAGHVHAGNLLVFRDRGALTPLSDAALRELYETPDEAAAAKIAALLSDPSYARLRGLLLRLYALRGGARPDQPEDAALAAALSCWEWVTECTIVAGLEMPLEAVPPLTPLFKDKALRERYAAARAAAEG